MLIKGFFVALVGLSMSINAADLEVKTQPWRQVSFLGVDYVSLAEVMDFYQLKSPSAIGTALAYANKNTSLVLDSAMPFVLINGVAVKLLHPLRVDGRGEQLISKPDCVHLLDPVLRPQYVAPRFTLRRIVIDPSHGGSFQGVRVSEREEKASLVLQVARSLQSLLEAQGFEVLMTRQDDYFVSQQDRVDLANSTADALFIQLRLNDYNESLCGIQSYIAEPDVTRDIDALNSALGMTMQSYLTVGAGFKDDGLRRVKNDMLAGVRVPAVAVALGNMGNTQQRLDLHDETKQQAIVAAIQGAINAFAVAVAPAKPQVQDEPVAPALEEVQAEEVQAEEIQAVEVE